MGLGPASRRAGRPTRCLLIPPLLANPNPPARFSPLPPTIWIERSTRSSPPTPCARPSPSNVAQGPRWRHLLTLFLNGHLVAALPAGLPPPAVDASSPSSTSTPATILPTTAGEALRLPFFSPSLHRRVSLALFAPAPYARRPSTAHARATPAAALYSPRRSERRLALPPSLSRSSAHSWPPPPLAVPALLRLLPPQPSARPLVTRPSYAARTPSAVPTRCTVRSTSHRAAAACASPALRPCSAMASCRRAHRYGVAQRSSWPSPWRGSAAPVLTATTRHEAATGRGHGLAVPAGERPLGLHSALPH
nr:extensin-like [Aegilops tauschii subsp. strangulata]